MKAERTEWIEPVLRFANVHLADTTTESLNEAIWHPALNCLDWPLGWRVIPPHINSEELPAAQDDLRNLLAEVISAREAWKSMEVAAISSPVRRKARQRDVASTLNAVNIRDPHVKQIAEEFKKNPTTVNMIKLRAHAARDALGWSILRRCPGFSGSNLQMGITHYTPDKSRFGFLFELRTPDLAHWYGAALIELIRIGLDRRLRCCRWEKCNGRRRLFHIPTNSRGPTSEFCCDNHRRYHQRRNSKTGI